MNTTDIVLPIWATCSVRYPDTLDEHNILCLLTAAFRCGRNINYADIVLLPDYNFNEFFKGFISVLHSSEFLSEVNFRKIRMIREVGCFLDFEFDHVKSNITNIIEDIHYILGFIDEFNTYNILQPLMLQLLKIPEFNNINTVKLILGKILMIVPVEELEDELLFLKLWYHNRDIDIQRLINRYKLTGNI